MKHYFYFKKGQNVPQWLMRQRHGETMEVIQVAKFAMSGKVMVDDNSGRAVIWPGSRRGRCVIHISGNDSPIVIDSDDLNSVNAVYSGSLVKGVGITPLAHARRCGESVFTTTKCKPIPDFFHRVATR